MTQSFIYKYNTLLYISLLAVLPPQNPILVCLLQVEFLESYHEGNLYLSSRTKLLKNFNLQIDCIRDQKSIDISHLFHF